LTRDNNLCRIFWCKNVHSMADGSKFIVCWTLCVCSRTPCRLHSHYIIRFLSGQITSVTFAFSFTFCWRLWCADAHCMPHHCVLCVRRRPHAYSVSMWRTAHTVSRNVRWENIPTIMASVSIATKTVWNTVAPDHLTVSATVHVTLATLQCMIEKTASLYVWNRTPTVTWDTTNTRLCLPSMAQWPANRWDWFIQLYSWDLNQMKSVWSDGCVGVHWKKRNRDEVIWH